MSLKKKLLLLAGLAAALLIAAGGFLLYRSYHPYVVFARVVRDSDARFEEPYYCEVLMMISGTPSLISIAPSVEEKMKEYAIWNHIVEQDLYENYVAPLHITVSGEVKDGKTTFCYEGYVTTPQGDTIDYREEKTFDHVFAPQEELFL